MIRIDVAVGILLDEANRVLIGQRVVRDRYYRKWEFPGGKFELGETAEMALQREILEETGLLIEHSEPFMLLEHDYPDRQVKLHIRLVRTFSGTLTSMEGQALKWLAIDDLLEMDFLDGNKAILEKLRKAKI